MANKELTWSAAIEKVLREAGEALHYQDITERILSQGLRSEPSPTPSYTVSAQFSMDKQLGEKSKFCRISKGVYGLREWLQDGHTPQQAIEEDTLEDVTTELSVQAYGIFWDRYEVDWTKASPRILGQEFDKSGEVDFCEQRGIYALFDHRDIVYVGRATKQSLGSRLRDHTIDRLRSRWNRFSWFGFHSVTSNGSLLAPTQNEIGIEQVISILEAVLIELTEPPQNRQQGKGLSGIEYLQRLDQSERNRKNQDLLTLASKLIREAD